MANKYECIPPIIVDHVIDTQAIIEAIIFGPTDIYDLVFIQRKCRKVSK